MLVYGCIEPLRSCCALHINSSTVKVIYSEKATNFCEIFPLLLSYEVLVKSKGKISQNFVAFSEYMNCNINFCSRFRCKRWIRLNKKFCTLVENTNVGYLWKLELWLCNACVSSLFFLVFSIQLFDCTVVQLSKYISSQSNQMISKSFRFFISTFFYIRLDIILLFFLAVAIISSTPIVVNFFGSSSIVEYLYS